MNKIIFWAVDCQQDFINPDGKLYVQDAEKIKPNLKYLTDLAIKNNIQVVSTGDWHTEKDVELSDNPDFLNTFPEHCMAGSDGAMLIEETRSGITNFDNTVVVDYNNKELDIPKIYDATDILIQKNKFDVFEGNPFTGQILDILGPDIVVVYGVATSFCVHYAVKGLIDRGIKVVVVEDAIKDLPNIDTNKTMDQWKNWEVQIVPSKWVEFLVKITKVDGYDN
ncbi:MAG: cysteine hydrolase [Novosphingobium sp.]|nr:cysteine hydrolase [Novosphingobium sp.]